MTGKNTSTRCNTCKRTESVTDFVILYGPDEGKIAVNSSLDHLFMLLFLMNGLLYVTFSTNNFFSFLI